MHEHPKALTYQQKLAALAYRFYQGAVWTPSAGDHYTTSRADLQLYRVVKIENDRLFTEYCERPGVLDEWDADTFTTEAFGPRRVHVPEFILTMPVEEVLDMETMVSRFLTWSLPETVKPDLCVLDPTYPHRYGTNLMNAPDTRAMLEHVLGRKG